MKRIFLSLGMLLGVGAIVAGGTIAFYNDTETSTGNIFVAGSIDLKVDHLKQTYNGMDCETCSLTLLSDEQSDVVDSTPNATVQGPFPVSAELVSAPHANWAPEFNGAEWIWAQTSTSASDSVNEVEYTFEREFNWNGSVEDITFDMSLGSDNGYAIYLNDVLLVDNLDSEFNYNAVVQPLNGLEAQFESALELGNNTLTIIVRNHAMANGTPASNPGGLLYYLNIERADCEDDVGFQNACRLWTEKDLEDGDTFFNFGDIKPSDHGTNLISLHAETNEAYACLIPNGIEDTENTRIEPEETAGDNTTGVLEGELSQFIKIFAWNDINYDGVYQNTEDVLIEGNTPLIDVSTSLDAMTLQPETTGYIGLAWCVGTQSTDGSTCSGNASGIDMAQTDATMASLTAYAVQTRNNEEFSCSDVDLDIPDQQ
ncbi:MAG: SipW-dependent-type signal peptide-containing protein [Minisyncoccota bacterium]